MPFVPKKTKKKVEAGYKTIYLRTDYKQMYLELIRGTERAINTLIDAQRRCEELYISA